MYRIKSASGAEAVYSSLEEFTAAVRRGLVAPEDEIFHSRANRWLDVKSHPHYRSAVNWSGPLSADAIFSSEFPSPPPPAPKVVAPPVTTVNHHGAGRLQVAEIPVQRPVATTVHRAQPSSAAPPEMPPAAAPAPPIPASPAPRRDELEFIDVAGPPAPPRLNAKVIEARKPPQPSPALNPLPAAKPRPSRPVADAEFLVADTGIERPVRDSRGHRTVSGDADMLFDTPLAAKLPPSQAASVVPATVVAQTPTPAPAATKAPDAKKKVVPPKVVAAPVATIDAPKAVEAPAAARRPAPPEDLDIPGPPLLESPVLTLSPAVQPITSTVTTRSLGMAIGVGAGIMLLSGVLLFWRPWSHQQPVATNGDSADAMAQVQGLPPFMGIPETSTTAPGTARQGVTAADSDAPNRPAGDSTQPADEVIASRPTLNTAVAMPGADLELGTDLAGPLAGSAPTPADLARRLETAERQAQHELTARLSNFKGVLTTARLATRDGVRQAQVLWAGGADALRLYRARIARIEQAYEDSVLVAQRQRRWSGDEMRSWASRQSLSEPAETSQLTDLVLNQVGEGLSVLASLDGQYELRQGVIRFKNAGSAPRYLSIRNWVEQRRDSWASAPETTRPYSVNVLLRALGEGFPPLE